MHDLFRLFIPKRSLPHQSPLRTCPLRSGTKAALTDSETGIKVPFRSDKFNFTLIWESKGATLSPCIRIQVQPSHYLWQLWERVGERGSRRGEEKEKRSPTICLRRAQIMEICCVSRHTIFLSFPQTQTRLSMSGWVTVHSSEDALAGVACAACFW